MAELRECPFCGYTTTLQLCQSQASGWWYVQCNACSIKGPGVSWEESEPGPAAIHAWNLRAPALTSTRTAPAKGCEAKGEHTCGTSHANAPAKGECYGCKYGQGPHTHASLPAPTPEPAKVTREEAIAEFRMDELDAVMLSVDKWLDGDELKDNPATRAARAREVALCAIEEAQGKPSNAPTPGDRVREAARRLITACRQHDIGGVGTVQEYLNAQHALAIELAKTEALNTPAPADGEGKVREVALDKLVAEAGIVFGMLVHAFDSGDSRKNEMRRLHKKFKEGSSLTHEEVEKLTEAALAAEEGKP